MFICTICKYSVLGPLHIPQSVCWIETKNSSTVRTSKLFDGELYILVYRGQHVHFQVMTGILYLFINTQKTPNFLIRNIFLKIDPNGPIFSAKMNLSRFVDYFVFHYNKMALHYPHRMSLQSRLYIFFSVSLSDLRFLAPVNFFLFKRLAKTLNSNSILPSLYQKRDYQLQVTT